jgi:hypothetical protein
MTSEPFAVVAAYQRLRLREIRGLYDELDHSLGHYLGVEQGISKELDSLEGESAEVRKALLSLGVNLRASGAAVGPAGTTAPTSPGHRRVDSGRSDGFRDLVSRAEGYMQEAGLDPNRDPLLQVLGSSEVAGIEGRYKGDFGEVAWDESDYLVVILAGFVATLLDLCLVRIPTDGAFLGKMQQGSPLTKWLRDNSKSVHQDYLGHLEKAAKVPYDLSIGDAVDGLRPKVHRLMSLGHDPVLGFVFGVKDIMDGTGTYVDKNGDLVRIDTSMSPERLTVAFLKVFLHLLSDVGTSAGVQPPFFTLLQLVKAKSPFVLGPSGERVSWTDVARYMYAHGYDLRHFATMGVVPASVEMNVRAVVAVQELRERRRPGAREGEADLHAAACPHDCRLREPAQDGGDLRHEPAGPQLGADAEAVPRDDGLGEESLKRDRAISARWTRSGCACTGPRRSNRSPGRWRRTRP